MMLEGEENMFDKLANSYKRNKVLTGNSEIDDLEKHGHAAVQGGSEEVTISECFLSHDTNKNDSLDITEFQLLVKKLFTSKSGNAYEFMEENKIKTIFDIFDKSGDEMISRDEFLFCWTTWILKVFC